MSLALFPALSRLACLFAMTVLAPGAQAASAATMPEVRIQNLGAEQTDVPFTFGQVFMPGALGKNDGLAARQGNGKLLPLQADIKATYADGSVRHAVVSGILPKLAAGGQQSVDLVKAARGPAAGADATIQRLLASGLSASVDISLDGVAYRATLADALAKTKDGAWLDGAVAKEWRGAVPFKSVSGAHPLLSAVFAVRWYTGLEKQARVEVVVENTKTFQAGARNLDYDVEVEVAGRKVYQKTGLRHFHHARWRQLAWWNEERAPAIHIRPDTAYLVATRAIPNYDLTLKPPDSALASLAKRLTPDKTGPMTIGLAVAYMPTSGGRGDIGPLPSWTVHYLLSTDVRARDTMVAAAEGAASWPIHMRDERTGYPLRTDTPANRTISTHMNMAHKGPLPVPRCAGKGLCNTPYTNDASHQPSLAFVPYLLTGDYYYLEELHFWAAANPLATDPNNSGNGQGLVRWQQVRGQAWSLRTLGHAAWITPDSHPLKNYFSKQLDNNLNFYHATYVVGKPNRLGAYDGSGQAAFPVGGSAPWQDDFLTWSFGYLAELGYEKALPILRWKAAYPVGRMTAPGFCWTEAAAYWLKFREADKGPVFDSFAKLYQANYDGPSYRKDDGKRATNPDGSRFIDQPCASQAQADWLSAAYRRTWTRGRMSGYSGSAMGYPANMQPALAVAATSGIPNAVEAWERFNARADQPDYAKLPQWAIVPRR